MAGLSFPTALGTCRIEWSDQGLTAFRLPQDERLEGNPPQDEAPAWVSTVIEKVQLHLDGTAQDFGDARYDFSSLSSFHREVLEAALKVRSGQTETYGGLAKRAGYPVSVSRAVGTALGQNPWPLLVPCHRFVGADGKMTGFSGPGGIKTKLRLLALEGAELFAE